MCGPKGLLALLPLFRKLVTNKQISVGIVRNSMINIKVIYLANNILDYICKNTRHPIAKAELS